MMRCVSYNTPHTHTNLTRLSFLLIGDLGAYPAPASDTTAALVEQWRKEDRMHFVALIGDLSCV
jgi:hypothetical protein